MTKEELKTKRNLERTKELYYEKMADPILKQKLKEYNKNKYEKNKNNPDFINKRDAYAKKYREENRPILKVRRQSLYSRERKSGKYTDYSLRKFGITVEHYNKILESQNGVCKICGKFRISKIQERMGIDHCHETGKIRGILCYKCNFGIGAFNDNTELLKIAIEYLKHSKIISNESNSTQTA